MVPQSASVESLTEFSDQTQIGEIVKMSPFDIQLIRSKGTFRWIKKIANTKYVHVVEHSTREGSHLSRNTVLKNCALWIVVVAFVSISLSQLPGAVRNIELVK